MPVTYKAVNSVLRREEEPQQFRAPQGGGTSTHFAPLRERDIKKANNRYKYTAKY